MTLDEQIASLLEEAAPLRELQEDDPAKGRLGGIVDRINELRAVQAGSMLAAELNTPIEGQDAPEGVGDNAGDPLPPVIQAEPIKRGPGRPRKAE